MTVGHHSGKKTTESSLEMISIKYKSFTIMLNICPEVCTSTLTIVTNKMSAMPYSCISWLAKMPLNATPVKPLGAYIF